MNDAASIALTFLGPILIFILFFHRFRSRLKPVQILVIGIIIYVLSFATGLLTVRSIKFQRETGNVVIGVIAGVIAPLIYCSLFTLFSRPGTPSVSATTTLPAQPAASGQRSEVSSPWSPIVIAAIIQAIATIIVALIAHSK